MGTVALSGGADTTVTAGNCYRYRVTVSDRVGNASNPSAASATAKVGTATPTVTATAPAAISGAANQYWAAGSKTLWFRPAGSGSFQLTATATDDAAGIDHVAFPDLSALNGFSGTGGSDTSDPYASTTYAWAAGATGDPGARQIVATSNSSQTGSDTVTISPDSTAPTGQSSDLAGGPWYSTASVPLTLDLGTDAASGVDASSLVVERAAATLSNGACGAFGSWSTVTLAGGADTSVTSGNCYRYRISVSDFVGNVSTPSAPSVDAKIDTSAPSIPNLAVSEASAFSYATGTTLYYNPQGSNSGSFDVAATSSDPQSGIDKIAFPAVTGTTGGGDDTSSPYFTTYNWTSLTSASGAQSVTAHNAAGLTASAAFTLTPDTTAPTGQSVDLSGGPWYSSLAVPLTIDTGADAGAGIDASTLAVERSSATLAGGTCGTFGSWSTVTLAGGSDTTVTTGNCYRYRISVSDFVGNTSAPSTPSADAKIDTTAPTVTVNSPTAARGVGAQHYVAGTKTLWFRPTGSGSFTLNATASDTESGVDHVAFPGLSGSSGWTGAGNDDTSSPYASTDYTWSAGAAGPGAKSVTAFNGGGTSASDSLTISADSTAPTGQSAALTAGPWYSTASVDVTLDNGTDSESGIDNSSAVVERSSAPLSAGTCGSFGSWSPVTLSGGSDTTVASGNCYRYRYSVADNVGNVGNPSAASADAKVDTTAPSAPNVSITESSAFSSVTGTTLYYNPQGSNSGTFSVGATSSDPESGVASSPSRTCTAATAPPTPRPVLEPLLMERHRTASGVKTVTVTNGAATTSSGSFTVTPDTTAPTGQSVSLSGGPWFASDSVDLTLANGSDSGAGIDSSSGVVERDSATLAGSTCAGFSGTWTTGDARRRRRHERDQRALLPLPLPRCRPGRQRQCPVRGQRRCEDRFERSDRHR